MPLLTIVTGVILDVIGLAGFVLSGSQSLTALIPCIFGTILLLCGILAMAVPKTRKHAMHAAALVALLGFLAIMGRSGAKLPALFSGQPVEPSATAVSLQLIFAVVCFLYVVACIRSFIEARRSARN